MRKGVSRNRTKKEGKRKKKGNKDAVRGNTGGYFCRREACRQCTSHKNLVFYWATENSTLGLIRGEKGFVEISRPQISRTTPPNYMWRTVCVRCERRKPPRTIEARTNDEAVLTGELLHSEFVASKLLKSDKNSYISPKKLANISAFSPSSFSLSFQPPHSLSFSFCFLGISSPCLPTQLQVATHTLKLPPPRIIPLIPTALDTPECH